MSSRRCVLAVLMDAAEPSLVLDLIERGALPALARLRDEGSWASVRSPAPIGSESVYPSFSTGADPQHHGHFGGWPWSPDKMSVVPLRMERLPPFWGSLSHDGPTVAVLDVPLAPHVGLTRGFEITEWGGHHLFQGQ